MNPTEHETYAMRLLASLADVQLDTEDLKFEPVQFDFGRFQHLDARGAHLNRAGASHDRNSLLASFLPWSGGPSQAAGASPLSRIRLKGRPSFEKASR